VAAYVENIQRAERANKVSQSVSQSVGGERGQGLTGVAGVWTQVDMITHQKWSGAALLDRQMQTVTGTFCRDGWLMD
jgi:isocitrate lyase